MVVYLWGCCCDSLLSETDTVRSIELSSSRTENGSKTGNCGLETFRGGNCGGLANCGSLSFQSPCNSNTSTIRIWASILWTICLQKTNDRSSKKNGRKIVAEWFSSSQECLHDPFPRWSDENMTQHLYKDGRGFYVTPSVLQLTDPTKMSHQMKQGTTVMFRKFRDELSQTCCTLFIVLHICASKIYKYKYIRVYLHHFILCNKTLSL